MKLTWPALQQLPHNKTPWACHHHLLRQGSKTEPEYSGINPNWRIRRQLQSCRTIPAFNLTQNPELCLGFSPSFQESRLPCSEAWLPRAAPTVMWNRSTLSTFSRPPLSFPELELQTLTEKLWKELLLKEKQNSSRKPPILAGKNTTNIFSKDGWVLSRLWCCLNSLPYL